MHTNIYRHAYYVHSIDVTLSRGSSGFEYEFKSGLSVLKPSDVHLTLKQSKNLSNFRIKVAVSFVSSCLKCSNALATDELSTYTHAWTIIFILIFHKQTILT